jgi:chemotaxis protein CheD
MKPPTTPQTRIAEPRAHATPTAAPAEPAARLSWLRAQPRKPGEASFFWPEAQWRCVAVKVLPGEYFVSGDDVSIMTTLGSCIATCLWDRRARVGGMNHFMLPDGGRHSGRYGVVAMRRLIDELLALGATPDGLQAKVFGGGQVVAGIDSLNVGERNTRFALDYLRTEGIPVVGKDVLDVHPRKVCFMPCTGKAMVRRLACAHSAQLVARGRAVPPLPASAAARGRS